MTIGTGPKRLKEKMKVSIKITLEVQTTAEAKALLDRLSDSTAPVSATSVEPSTGGNNHTEAPVSAAVQQFADENGVDLSSLTGSGKDGRITKGDVKAEIKRQTPVIHAEEEDDPFDPSPAVAPAPAPVEEDDDDPFSLDEEEEPEEYTKEDVRKYLVEYQTLLKAKFVEKGRDEVDASKAAQERARAVLTPYAETLGALDESKYAAVVEAAKKNLAKLKK